MEWNQKIVGDLECRIEVVNSTLVYRNTNDDTELNISQNTVKEREIANTIILTYNTNSIDFRTVNAVTADEVNNCLFWNYGSGAQAFTNTTVNDSLLEDPLLIGGDVLTQHLFNIATTMAKNFQPTFESPCRDAGSVAHSNGLETDILGRARRFENGAIDIGPYEIHVYIFSFSPDRIKSIFQDKLTYNATALVFTATETKIIYEDLPKEFVYDQDTCEEFARESKVFIELKEYTKEYEIVSDKKHELITEIDAFYDLARQTIVFKKPSYLFGNVLSNVFEDGRYVFHFDSGFDKLKVYFSNTYNKGMSGHRSVVKNIRFGGPTLVHI